MANHQTTITNNKSFRFRKQEECSNKINENQIKDDIIAIAT